MNRLLKFAEAVGKDLRSIDSSKDDHFAVSDNIGRTALRVTPSGDVTIGASTVKEGSAGFRVTDSDGRIALDIDESGRVTIPDLTTDTTASETHVFLAAGQSNMQGFARPVGGDLDPINPRILQFGASSQKVEPAPAILDNPGGQIGLSPARVFAAEYLKTQPDHVSVLLVPYAWGGTGFNSGSGNGATWDDRQATGGVRDLYTESVAQTLDALAAAGENAELKGILWHQGESNQNDSFEDYAAQLDRLIDNYRSDLGNTNLPFLIGQMTQEGFEVTPRKLIIDAAHQDTLRRKRYIGFAPSTSGSTNYNDTTHFSRRGVEKLGAEYVAAYFRALDNAPGFGPQQPVNVSAKFINGTLTVVWEQQPRRVTGYRVEYRIDGGAWTEVTREYPMNLSEHVAGLSGTVAEVRVTCINLAQETTQLYPTIAPHIQY